jgi:hypothetical protein
MFAPTECSIGEGLDDSGAVSGRLRFPSGKRERFHCHAQVATDCLDAGGAQARVRGEGVRGPALSEQPRVSEMRLVVVAGESCNRRHPEEGTLVVRISR